MGQQWAEVLRNDLAFIAQQARENHPGWVDEQNPRFREWLEAGLVKAMEGIADVDSEEAVRRRIMEYMAGFADGHFGVEFHGGTATMRWAGVWLTREGSRYVVRDCAAEWPVPLPEAGEALISCDGQPVDELMTEQVLKAYFNDPTASFPKSRFAPDLLLGDFEGVPPRYRDCVFERADGVRREYAMQWGDFSIKDHHPRSKVMAGKPHYSIERYRGLYWVRLTSFQPGERDLKLFREVLRKLELIKGPETVVFDVRCNSGGSSSLGADAIRALYGEAVIRYLDEKAKRGQKTTVEYRVSRSNLAHIRSVFLPVMEKLNGLDSAYYQFVRLLEERMQTALDRGEDLLQAPDLDLGEIESSSDQTAIDFSTLPKSVVVTDEYCGSACLDFLDIVKALPASVHLGKETSGDSVYMEGRGTSLPSGLGHLVIPIKVYRNRPRGNNASYKPDREFHGNLYDDEALKRWVSGVL